MSSRALAGPQYFLPHHTIFRPESTTKIRVVFDGSSRGSDNVSLNDSLFVGPSFQPLLYSTVVNFRMSRFVVSADADKMFRQVWVHPDDRRFNRFYGGATRRNQFKFTSVKLLPIALPALRTTLLEFLNSWF